MNSNKKPTPNWLKPILIFLALSILSGVFYDSLKMFIDYISMNVNFRIVIIYIYKYFIYL